MTLERMNEIFADNYTRQISAADLREFANFTITDLGVKSGEITVLTSDKADITYVDAEVATAISTANTYTDNAIANMPQDAILPDGSKDMNAGYTPLNPLSVTTKEYVDRIDVNDVLPTIQNRLLPVDGADYGTFGKSVDISGNRIVVGAMWDDNTGGIFGGTAHVFDLDGNELFELAASDIQASDKYGTSVAINSTHIVVGAPEEDTLGSNAGTVYIYNIDGTNEIIVRASDGAIGDMFGYSVAITDTKVIVGAQNHATGGTGWGAVYIYNLDGTGETKITPTDINNTKSFGEAVAASGNLIVVGAGYSTVNTQTSAGWAFLYDTSGNFIAQLQHPSPQAYDQFGYYVETDGTTVVVGAIGNDGPGGEMGAFYIFDAAGNYNTEVLHPAYVSGSSTFGGALDVSGDIIVAGDMYAAGTTGEVYSFNSSTGAYIETFTSGVPLTGGYFGAAVAIDGSSSVFTATGEKDGTLKTGAAYTNIPQTNNSQEILKLANAYTDAAIANVPTQSLFVKTALPPASLAYFGTIVYVIGDLAYMCVAGTETPTTDGECSWVQI